jgi:AP-4 complex subunit epsilon-1
MKKIEKSEYNIEVLKKIMELMERFAPSKQWFIKISNDLFINFGEMIDDEIITKLVEILFEWEKESESLEEFKKLTIENYATIVENYSIIPSSLVKLISLITGEYANKLYENDEEKIKGII